MDGKSVFMEKLSMEDRCLPSGPGRENSQGIGAEQMRVWPVQKLNEFQFPWCGVA